MQFFPLPSPLVSPASTPTTKRKQLVSPFWYYFTLFLAISTATIELMKFEEVIEAKFMTDQRQLLFYHTVR